MKVVEREQKGLKDWKSPQAEDDQRTERTKRAKKVCTVGCCTALEKTRKRWEGRLKQVPGEVKKQQKRYAATQPCKTYNSTSETLMTVAIKHDDCLLFHKF